MNALEELQNIFSNKATFEIHVTGFSFMVEDERKYELPSFNETEKRTIQNWRTMVKFDNYVASKIGEIKEDIIEKLGTVSDKENKAFYICDKTNIITLLLGSIGRIVQHYPEIDENKLMSLQLNSFRVMQKFYGNCEIPESPFIYDVEPIIEKLYTNLKQVKPDEAKSIITEIENNDLIQMSLAKAMDGLKKLKEYIFENYQSCWGEYNELQNEGGYHSFLKVIVEKPTTTKLSQAYSLGDYALMQVYLSLSGEGESVTNTNKDVIAKNNDLHGKRLYGAVTVE